MYFLQIKQEINNEPNIINDINRRTMVCCQGNYPFPNALDPGTRSIKTKERMDDRWDFEANE